MGLRATLLVGGAAWLLGSWVGTGATMPSRSVLHWHAPLFSYAAGPLPVDTPGRGDPPPAPVDANQLPDPVPWPRLNVEANVGKAWLLAEGPAPSPDSGRRLVTLTFDDGPFPETTPSILRALAEHELHATFFFVGRYMEGHDDRGIASREVARRVALEGHLIGNHTRDHELLTTATHARALEQIDDGAADIERATGKRPVFFRPPYGQLDPFAEAALRTRGAELVMWSVEASDMLNDDPDEIAASIEEQIERGGGGTVLLHDIRWSTVKALPKLLDWLHARRFDAERPHRIGYDVVDLVTYLRATGKNPQPYANRSALEHARAEGARHPPLPAVRTPGDA